MRFDLKRSPFWPEPVRSGDVFDLFHGGHLILTVRVLVPVSYRDGSWSLYCEHVEASG